MNQYPDGRPARHYCGRLQALAVSLLLASVSAIGQESILELHSTFKGNQEQPSVLYIVPWQKVDAPPMMYQPLQRLIDESLKPIDRDEFRREAAFVRQQRMAMEQSSAPGPAQ